MIAVHVEHTLPCDARRQRRNGGEDSGLRHDCFLSRYESFFSGLMFQENLCGYDQCLRAREAGEVERRMFGQRSSERRCTCFAGHQIHPAMAADTLRTRIRRALERSLKKAPASRFAEGLGTDSSPPSSPPTSRERHHCRLGQSLELCSLPSLLYSVGWHLAALFLCGPRWTEHALTGIVVENALPRTEKRE